METTESCHQCEKFEIHVETTKPILGSADVPNTYHAKTKKYIWKHSDMMAYAIIPRTTKGTSATIDMFLCIDEDIMDDIDVYGYAQKFFNEDILPRWKNIKRAQVTEPLLGSPELLPCWKIRHPAVSEESAPVPAMQE